MLGTTTDLVVAHFNESLNWLRRVPHTVRRFIYHKGLSADFGDRLPNVGREAHTYLHHIVAHYEELADFTVFCQGHPFDHEPRLHKILKDRSSGRLPARDFQWLGFLIDEDDLEGRLFRTWSKNPAGRPLDLAGFLNGLLPDSTHIDLLRFYGGAQFIVSERLVRSKPVSYYRKALDLAMRWPDAAHCFERVWDRVFGLNGIPEAYRTMPCPIYLKPIKATKTPSEGIVRTNHPVDHNPGNRHV